MSITLDEAVREVAELVLGAGADELIAKMEPTQSDVSTSAATKDRRKRKITAGLSAVGAGAGALGLAVGAKEVRRKSKELGGLKAGWRGTNRMTRALVPVEIAGLGGELMATKILHGDTKRPKVSSAAAGAAQNRKTGQFSKGILIEKYSKAFGVGQPPSPEHRRKRERHNQSLLDSAKHPSRAVVLRALPPVEATGIVASQKAKGKLKAKVSQEIETHRVHKSDEIDVRWDAEISKADPDKQQVFGWASVVEVNGEPVVDRQGDYISPEEMEKAGYEYVLKSRKGGDMHLRNNWEPIQKSELIESFLVTPDKREAMGLPDSVPSGWWVGFQVQDAGVWDLIKKGERTGFSIHGHGRRTNL